MKISSPGVGSPRSFRRAVQWFSTFTLGASLFAEIAPSVWEADFSSQPDNWLVYGDNNLFEWSNQGLLTTWDSSKPNSYFYLPLGITLTTADDFEVALEFSLSDIEIGTTPGKPYTFQIGLGLINIASALDPELHRASGINPKHGPRNLVEFNYFPDSGFGATVAPTLVTKENQIGFSGNYPLALETGRLYRVEMSFTAGDRTLRSRIWQDGELFAPLEDIVMDNSFADFHVNALAVASYSDAGQDPEYAGSVFAHGLVSEFGVTVWHRPQLQLSRSEGEFALRFQTDPGWNYILEVSGDLALWTENGQPVSGTGEEVELQIGNDGQNQFFRIRAERLN